MSVFSSIKGKYHERIREKAIGRAQTRIIIAGKSPEDFSEEELEIIVKEEEDKILGDAKEKGLLALAALLGLSLWS